MPIKGLTDRNLSFPEIGQIRKGAKKENEFAPGKDLTYFRVEFDEKETKAAKQFLDNYGMEPTEINIIIPFNEIDQVWDAWYEAYTAGRMVARADGEKYIYKVDTATGNITCKNGAPYIPFAEGEVVGTYVNKKSGKAENVVCKPVGRLRVVIPELQRLAYLTVITTSIHDIGNLSAQLEALYRVNSGHIAGIPLVLRRRPKKISTPRPDGSRARYTKWMLSVEADPEWVKAKLIEVKKLALPGNGLALLPETTGHQEPVIEMEPEEDYSQYTDPDEEAEDIPSNPVADGEFTPEKPEKMTLATANSVRASDGRLYGDIQNEQLSVMRGEIEKRIARNNLSPSDKDELHFKIDAIDTIINYRSKPSGQGSLL